VERERLQAYMKTHNIEDMVQSLVEGLLKDKPKTRPKEHWAHMLRLEKIKKVHKDQDIVSGMTYAEEASASELSGHLIAKLFTATRKITSEIVPKETISLIINESLQLLECDRVSLFVHDKRLDMLKLNASNMDVVIRVKPGQGIAGHVFTTKETVNIPDCYSDNRFDQAFDKMTGYRTKCLLTMPIVDNDGECRGVLQAINKNADESGEEQHFTHIDELIMDCLTLHVGVALRNADLYGAAIVVSERSNALLSMIQSLSQDLGAQSTVLTITMHANQLVQADRCTVFLIDERKQQLRSVSTSSGKEISIPKSAGIAGESASKGELIVIDDCYADPRFNPSIDKQTGYKTTSMLVVPVLRRRETSEDRGKVLAVIQMINKMEFDGQIGKFDEEDVNVMETCASFAASKLEGASFIEKISKKESQESEGDMAVSDKFSKRGKKGKDPLRQSSNGLSLDCSTIEDNDDEDEDDDDDNGARSNSKILASQRKRGSNLFNLPEPESPVAQSLELLGGKRPSQSR